MGNMRSHRRWSEAISATGFVVFSFCMTPSASAEVPAGFVDASTFGFNFTDSTAALQAAIDSGQNVYVPNMGADWIVSPIMLTHSNQEIRFESGVVVSAKPGAFQAVDDALFTASGKSNITLNGYGATLVMRKSDYQQAPYAPAEWRHGINLLDVSGFEILGLSIKSTGGDGIYVGANSQSGYSQDIVVKDVLLEDNHRQGISIISVKNMLIDNAVILNTQGTAPEAGIDFEANYDAQRIANVTVRNTIIQGNNTYGILFAGSIDLAEPISVDIENVTIVGNGADGIRLYQPIPGVSITDSLVVGNSGTGLRGTSVTSDLIRGDLQGTGPGRNAINHSALWDNGNGANSGWTSLGTGTTTNIQPLFYSMDPASPYFLYLDPANAASILTGGHDGGQLGARPVYVPEPASVGATVVVCYALAAIRR